MEGKNLSGNIYYIMIRTRHRGVVGLAGQVQVGTVDGTSRSIDLQRLMIRTRSISHSMEGRIWLASRVYVLNANETLKKEKKGG